MFQMIKPEIIIEHKIAHVITIYVCGLPYLINLTLQYKQENKKMHFLRSLIPGLT